MNFKLRMIFSLLLLGSACLQTNIYSAAGLKEFRGCSSCGCSSCGQIKSNYKDEREIACRLADDGCLDDDFEVANNLGVVNEQLEGFARIWIGESLGICPAWLWYKNAGGYFLDPNKIPADVRIMIDRKDANNRYRPLSFPYPVSDKEEYEFMEKLKTHGIVQVKVATKEFLGWFKDKMKEIYDENEVKFGRCKKCGKFNPEERTDRSTGFPSIDSLLPKERTDLSTGFPSIDSLLIEAAKRWITSQIPGLNLSEAFFWYRDRDSGLFLDEYQEGGDFEQVSILDNQDFLNWFREKMTRDLGRVV